MPKPKERDSGVELLKIFAMIIIVSCHVVMTLKHQELNGHRVFDVSMAGQGITNSIISALFYNGAIGNSMFFVCSAWFLIDSHKSSKRKILNIILDVWTISVIILAITFIISHGNIGTFEIIKNLFPVTYQTNWYITCYILFYAIHPLLNKSIDEMNQLYHFRMVFVMVFIYYIWSFFISIFGEAYFFGNEFIIWLVVYFTIAYMKKYMPKFCKNKKINIILLLIGIIGNYGLIFGMNGLSLISGFFIDKMQFWNNRNNPFIFLMAISLLNIAREVKWKNKAVNYISSLTLFIYVIHENWFIRSYMRPYMWDQINNYFGFDHVIMWIITMTLGIFVVSAVISAFYKETIHKLVLNCSDKIYDFIKLIYGRLEKRLLKLH